MEKVLFDPVRIIPICFYYFITFGLHFILFFSIYFQRIFGGGLLCQVFHCGMQALVVALHRTAWLLRNVGSSSQTRDLWVPYMSMGLSHWISRQFLSILFLDNLQKDSSQDSSSQNYLPQYLSLRQTMSKLQYYTVIGLICPSA